MLEIPEAKVISQQLQAAIVGQSIVSVAAGRSPHKFAWYYGDPQDYESVLTGKTISAANAAGGMVRIAIDDYRLLFGDGVALRLHPPGETPPRKHQLLMKLSNGAHLSGSVQMYGGLWCFQEGAFDNPYYEAACSKPDPLSKEFTAEYFSTLGNEPTAGRLSAKAFLATEQRIPGLGNGVLQDILFNTGIHPKGKMQTLDALQLNKLYHGVVQTLKTMTRQGGRDTEKDLYGRPGNYMTKMSRLTVGTPCPTCGETIRKESYMGGSIYYCPICQPLLKS